jgi:hypothetical protein
VFECQCDSLRRDRADATRRRDAPTHARDARERTPTRRGESIAFAREST